MGDPIEEENEDQEQNIIPVTPPEDQGFKFRDARSFAYNEEGEWAPVQNLEEERRDEEVRRNAAKARAKARERNKGSGKGSQSSWEWSEWSWSARGSHRNTQWDDSEGWSWRSRPY